MILCRGVSSNSDFTVGGHILKVYCSKVEFLFFRLVCLIFQTKYIYIGYSLWNINEGEDLQSNSYTMDCPPIRGDNPRALASGISYVQVDNHGKTIIYHLHQCWPCTSRDISS